MREKVISSDLIPLKKKIHGIKLKDIDINHTAPLKPDHWEIICDTLYRVEDKFLTNLLYFGGLRLTEVHLLNIEDFDQKTNIIHLKRKGGYKHALKIQHSKKIFDLLDLYLVKNKRGLTGLLFLSKNGHRTTNKTIYNRVMSILKNAAFLRPLLHTVSEELVRQIYTFKPGICFLLEITLTIKTPKLLKPTLILLK